MTDQCYLAIDLGAESGRVMAGLFDGSRMRVEEIHRFANGGVRIRDSLRWNVLGLWSEIEVGLRKAARYADSIVSIGVDTWGVDFVLLSETDELLGLPCHYRDARTQGMLAKACSRVPREQIFAETGQQFMEINSLYQLLAMHETNRRLLEQADCLLMIPDFFHWCLCGSRVVEFTNATTTQMLHPTRRDWSTELLRQFELPTSMLPRVVDPGTKLGQLRGDVAERTGMKRVDVIAPATHDTGSAVAAVPTEQTGRTDWAYISSGTWSLMGVEVQDAVLDARVLERNVTNEGGVEGTYRLLRNITGLWLVQQARRSFERRGRSFDYGQLTALAAAAPAFRALIDPDHADFLNPDDMVTAIQKRCRDTGQAVPESEGQIVRCALESLALKCRMVLGWLEELTGTPVGVIHIVGGGTQNQLLNQFTASACGSAVVAGPVEATALGNALVQARSRGEVASLADIRSVVTASTQLQRYDPQDSVQWQEAWQRFRQLVA